MDDICNFEQSVIHTGRDSRMTQRTLKTQTQTQFLVPRFLHPSEKAKHHLERLKSRVGMQTHVAHPRPFRDVSSVKKDFELALKATKKLEMSHYSFDRGQKTGMTMALDSSGTNFTKKGFGLDTSRESPKNEEKFPLNNPVFNTLWEKLFANKNGGVRPINKEEGMLMKKEDPLQDKQRLKSRYLMANGATYWKEQKDIYASNSKNKARTLRNQSFDSKLLINGNDTERAHAGLYTKRSQAKKELFKMVGFWATSNNYPANQKDMAESTAQIMKANFYKTDLLVSGGAKSRGRSSGTKFGSVEFDLQEKVHPNRDPKLRFESPSRKKYLAKMMFQPYETQGQRQLYSSRIDDEIRTSSFCS